ncbi:MAG: DUF839 domain-containing protein [Leptospiraceae bacterium]|nr:DUF839 domain-containing protein [Leptospiraceae bacterium]MDW7977126.1 DUF839 domain-containing protein [Leptospiraceae bacterium]
MKKRSLFEGFYRLVLDQPVTSFNRNWCGTLYAARLTQTDGNGGGSFDINWIELGRGCDQEVKAIIDKKPKLSDIFQVAAASGGNCPAGYTFIREDELGDGQGYEYCLNLRVGSLRSPLFANDAEVRKAAAFLETRKYARYLGATIEFEKGEGLSYDPDNKKIYFDITAIRGGMSDGRDHIQLQENICGAVYELDVDDNLTATKMRAIVVGERLKPGEPYFEIYTCNPNKIAAPDNLRYIGQNILLIGEDTRFHFNNMIWAYDLKRKTLTRIGTIQTGGEVTGMFEYANINGQYVLTANVQHAFVDRPRAQRPDLSGLVDVGLASDYSIDRGVGFVYFIKLIPTGIFKE